MIIWLPKKFIYTEKRTSDYAYVQNRTLFVNGYVNYEDLMYQLAYDLKGYDRCLYCGARLTPKNRTIDHVYPRRWGGVSIPNNMVPSCKNCNQQKRDMTYRQFKIWRNIANSEEKEAFYQECINSNQKIIRNGEFVLRSGWISEYDITKVAEYIPLDKLEISKSEKLSNYYKRWNQYPRPIIVSSDDWIFKGKHIIHHAKSIGKSKVPAIVLFNVNVVKNSCLD